MDFGREKDINLNNIDFGLPKVPSFTDKILDASLAKGKCHILVGSPNMGKKEWKGNIFPDTLPEKEFLRYTSNAFDFIELNATFYSAFSKDVIRGWREKSNASFLFCPKMSRMITHIKRFKNCEQNTDEFLLMVYELGDQLGPITIQLPDNAGPKHFDVILSYLEKLPRDLKFHVELRHSGWFQQEKLLETTFETFRSLGIGTILTDTMTRRDVLHMYLTTPILYLRYNGNNGHPTDESRLRAWINLINELSTKGLQQAFLAIHTPDAACQHKVFDSKLLA